MEEIMNSKSMRRAWMFGPVLSLSVALASCNGPVPAGTTTPGGGGGGARTGTGTGSGSDPGSGSGTGTGPRINLDPGATGTGISTSTEVTEQHACSVATNTPTKQVGDLLLILDRSSSMQSAMDSDTSCVTGRTDAATCQSRWSVVQATLKQVLAASADSVNWGLLLFSTPGQGSCTVADKVQVEIGAGNANRISTQISNAGTETTTPTRKAVNAGVKYLQGLTGPESKSILLATDGQPNCAGDTSNGGDDVGPATDAIKAAFAAGFKVYVLGIGPEAGTATLNGFADAGGTAIKDVSGAGKNYYAALSAEELSKHFASIVSSVASCTFTLDTAPDPSVPVAVEFDGDKSKRAPQDDADGWNFSTTDHKTIQLYGSWCDGLMNGTYKIAKVLVGCKGQPIP
jgi:hypothetical protein